MEHTANIQHQKTLARIIFPLIESQKTIYDAQTAVNALAGYIKLEIAKKAALTTIKDLPIDFSKEEDSPIKESMTAILPALQSENADKTSALLEKIGSSLAQFAAGKYMENPMSIIHVDDFIA